MSAGFLVAGVFFGSLWAQSAALHITAGLSPSLQLIAMIFFTLRWRGPEVHFLALLFGLGADIFSSMPFGVHGLVYFLLSFVLRYLAIKVIQGGLLVIPLLTALVALVVQVLVFLIDKNMEDLITPGFQWWTRLLLFSITPTALLSAPMYQLLIFIERLLGIRLAERKF